MSERPTHPKYGKALSGAPYTVHNVTFWPYRRGVNLYVRVSEDRRIEVFDQRGHTMAVTVDGETVPGKFRTRETAVAAALKIIAERNA